MRTISCLVLSLAFLAAGNAFGNDTPKANPFNDVLAAVPAAEMPAKAADLVLHAKHRDRQTVTVDVVKSAVGINPAAAPAIVGAIARAVPDMAAVAAGTAAAAQPKQASAIAKAAAAAAPSKAGKIVAAVCRAVPNEYRNIAVAVSQVVPDSSKEIVDAVASVLPELKPGLAKVLATYGGKVPSVAVTLDQAVKVAQTSTTSPSDPQYHPGAPAMTRGPAVGPPYIPLSGTPTYVTPGTSGQTPPGGRDYAKP